MTNPQQSFRFLQSLLSKTLQSRPPGGAAAPVASAPEMTRFLRRRTGLTFTSSLLPFLHCGHSALDEMWEVPGRIFFSRISPFVIFGRRGQKAVHWAPKHLLAYCGMAELHLPERRVCLPSLSLRVRKRDWNAGGGRSSSLATSKCKLKKTVSLFFFYYFFACLTPGGGFERKGR